MQKNIRQPEDIHLNAAGVPAVAYFDLESMENRNLEQTIRAQLRELATEDYRDFSSALIPGCRNMLGVRIPQIRKIAKQLAKEDPLLYLRQTNPLYFEETMLKGLIIGNLRADMETVLEQVAWFVPQITNWSVCDSFCAELKITRRDPERVWAFLQPYWQSGKTYDVRFAVVMMLDYYIDASHLELLFSIFDGIHHPDYYVKMAVAWAVSICFVKFPKETMDYLRDNQLDDETYNKALQKIRESKRVDPDTKITLKAMKRG